jgi:shikimate dehydrogenase
VRRYGLIGFPLGHSFSQRFFAEKFAREGIVDCRYDNFPLGSIDELPELIAGHPDLSGFNVTIPYKEAILPYLDVVDPEAAAIGAINCVRIDRSGGTPRLTGYNTDAFGFRQSLEQMLGGSRPTQALILGTGGASRAVGHVLTELGIAWKKVSRHASPDTWAYDELPDEVLRRAALIVNTTPLGTYPDVDSRPPLRYGLIGGGHFLHDLVYNPSETVFLREGRTRRATVKNGWQMLVAQAERSWEIWST